MPPPLPPASNELTMRVNMLETQRVAALDAAFENLNAELMARLRESQAFVVRRGSLQEQLQRCNSDWHERVELLEARMRQHQSDTEIRMKEVVRNIEMRSEEEAEQLRAQIEASRAASSRSRDEVQRRLQEDIDMLGSQLQATRRTCGRLDEARQNQDNDVERLEIALQAQVKEAQAKEAQTRQVEDLIRDLARQLEGVKSRDLLDLTPMEVTISQSTNELEELQRKVAAAEASRNQLSSDFDHMKKAIDQRTKEGESLRESIQKTKRESLGLKAQIEDTNQQRRLSSPRASNVTQVFVEKEVIIEEEDSVSSASSSSSQ